MVKPMEVASVMGKCHIQLSNDDKKNMDEPVRETSGDTTEVSQFKQMGLTPLIVPISTKVDDSDNEEESVVEEEAVVEPVVEEVVEPIVVKKILKKVVEPVVVEPVVVEPVVVEPVVVVEEAVETLPEPPKKKMVIKKKAV